MPNALPIFSRPLPAPQTISGALLCVADGIGCAAEGSPVQNCLILFKSARKKMLTLATYVWIRTS